MAFSNYICAADAANDDDDDENDDGGEWQVSPRRSLVVSRVAP